MRFKSLVAFAAISLAVSPMWAGTASVVPTTTYAAETGNNTSAADSFTATLNGLPAAGNVSKLPIGSLLYPGATTPVYAHWMPWFGASGHISVGYDSADPAQIRRQVDDMMSRGIAGVVIDWYGPASTHHNTASINMMHEAEVRGGNFVFSVAYDSGALKSCAATAGCDVTQKTINDLNYLITTFANSAAYLRWNGRPVLPNFGLENYALDWTRIRAGVAGNPLFLNRNSGGFTKPQTDGGYAWVAPETVSATDPMAMKYVDGFYATSLKYPNLIAWGSSYPGFNDALASWGSGRVIDRQCGQTWLATMAEAGKYYSTANQLEGLQLVTWNDYEEGSSLESGIENCVSVSASVSGNQLSWTLSGNENTVDHYTVFISSDGVNLQSLGDFPAGNRSASLVTFGFGPATYSVYVKAVGKATMTNHMSAAASYVVLNNPPQVSLAVSTLSGIAPATITATAAASDSDGSIASLSIDFGDGSVINGTSGSKASHTYSTPGSYTITARAVDNLGAPATATAAVTIVPNQPPQVSLALSATTGIAPAAITATVTDSDSDGSIAATSIDFGDGAMVNSTAANGTAAQHTYSTPGTYTVKAKATDNLGAVSFAIGTVTIAANQPPLVSVGATPTTGIAPATVGVTVTATDVDGSIASTSISFGDGAVAPGPVVSHVYSTPGTYTITATAKDDLGASTQATTTVTITANQPPVARLSLTPVSGIAPLPVTASTAASTDADGTVKSSTINFGDGSALVSGFSASHTYTAAGTYTVTATVSDDRGATSQTAATVVVSVPASAVTVSQPVAGATTSLKPRVVASGFASAGVIAMKVYVDSTLVFQTTTSTVDTVLSLAPGVHNLTVQQWDAKNVVTKKSLSITSVNSAPVATLSLNTNAGIAPVAITASAAASTDVDGNISSTSIDFGDGSAAIAGSSASHTYTKAGTYEVSATVTDSLGLSSTATATVTVAAAPVAPPQPVRAVTMTSPTAGGITGTVVRVTGYATSPAPITTMKVYVDGSTAYSGAAASVDTTVKMRAGTHTVTLQAWDSTGAVMKTSTDISVSNHALNGETNF